MASPSLTAAATGAPAHADRVAIAPGFWLARWGYPQALTVAITLAGAALVVQARFPHVAVDLPRGAAAWAIVFGPLVLVGALRLWRAHNPVLAGIGGVPMAVVSVLAMALLSVPGAIWPQGQEAPGWAHRLGFDHVFTSFPMAAASALVLLNLASCTARRLFSLRLADARFTLIHGGLLLAIAAALVGGTQLQRVRLPLHEGGAPSAIGLEGDTRFELPFAVALQDFRMTSYPPGFALARSLGEEGWLVKSGSEFLAAGTRERVGNYDVEVLEVIDRAGVVAGVPRSFAQEGAGPGVRARVSRDGDVLGESWLHAATPYGEELFVQLDDETVLLLQAPRPKSYESDVVILSEEAPLATTIAVNKPVRHTGWTIYQLDYDSARGEASSLSVLEAVRDPAYPVVAAGCWLAILGCIWFFWDAAELAARRRDDEEAVAWQA